MTTVRRTRRWRGVVGVTLFVAAVGLLASRPYLLLLSAVGVVFAAYPHLEPDPTVDLAVERTVDDENPRVGEAVEVTVTVRNVGDSIVPDLRFIDGVPPMLSVAEGTPRRATVLRPGGETTFSYAVTAKRGRHRFEPATAIARNASGSTEVETTVEDETVVRCQRDVPEVPLRKQTRQRVGRIVTDEGGAGVEFHRTREYQHGDPISRVDWRRFARTGELSTIEFRTERAASVVLLVDAREEAYRASDDEEPHAVGLGVAAAEEMVTSLLETPNSVGLAAVGREVVWLAPGSGTDHETRARRLLAKHPALSAFPPSGDERDADPPEVQLEEIQQRLSSETQVVVVTPLADEFVVEAVYDLEAAGYPVTVVSPDVTADGSLGEQLATVERRSRIRSVRDAEIPVVDWEPSTRLGTAIIDMQERWSA